MKIGMRHLQLFILLFATSSLLFQLPSDFEANAADAWYNDSWENRKKITTSLNTEISSDLTNFPTLISFTDSDLTKTTESDGADIVFTASDGTTELAYEIERFDSSTGEIIAWVNIPTVSASENTDIYIYYKGTASTPSTVWDSSYKLVYHLNQTVDGTVDEITDASGTGNHGTAGGTGDKTFAASRITKQVEAKIGYGQSFGGPTEPVLNVVGSGDFIWVNGVSSWPTDDVTVEFWVNVATDENSVNSMAILGYRAGGDSNELLLTRADSLNMLVRNDKLLDSDVDAATSDWTHIMVVYADGANKIYQDGTLQASSTDSTDGPRADGNFVLGADIDQSTKVNNELVGDMDEFRISNISRSADWAAASYANQNNPSSFLTIGPEGPLTVTITSSSGSSGYTVNSGTLSYTATFSSTVSDFTIGDITVTGTANGSSPAASNFAGSGTTYTFDIAVGSNGTVIVDIAADAATDTSSNKNSASNTYTLTAKLPPSGSTCLRHVILGNCGTIAINNDEYRIINTWTNVPTTEVLVGQPVTVTLSTPDNPTHTKIHFASVHTEVFSLPLNHEQSAHIDYSIMNNQVTYISQSQLFQAAGATHRISQDTNVKNLELFEVVFTMIFAKPMDTSHVVVETENKFGIPETLYLIDALKVSNSIVETLTLEQESKFELIYEPRLKVEPEPSVYTISIDPEPEMDPEPEIEMDPEPEQTKKEKSKRQRR